VKPLTYLINCAPEGAAAEWHQAGEEFKDSEDVIAVIAYSEYQAQAKRIAELEAGVVDIRDWTARWTRPDHPIVKVADRLLSAQKGTV